LVLVCLSVRIWDMGLRWKTDDRVERRWSLCYAALASLCLSMIILETTAQKGSWWQCMKGVVAVHVALASLCSSLVFGVWGSEGSLGGRAARKRLYMLSLRFRWVYKAQQGTFGGQGGNELAVQVVLVSLCLSILTCVIYLRPCI